jgi:hypothetical protein
VSSGWLVEQPAQSARAVAARAARTLETSMAGLSVVRSLAAPPPTEGRQNDTRGDFFVEEFRPRRR